MLRSAAGPSGPFDWSTHHLLDGDAVGYWYGGRVVEDTAGRPHLLTWRMNDDGGTFVGAVGDPLALEVQDGRLVRGPADGARVAGWVRAPSPR